MKKLVYILLLLVSTVAFSQSNTITYQAVIYLPSGQNAPGVDVTNLPMTNKNICLQFSFIDANNRVEYQEEIKVKTDEFGMVNITIGNGDQSGGYASSYDAIVWNASLQKNLQVALDARGLCNQFEILSNEPIASVPFANAAITAGNVSGVVALANGGTGATTAAAARTNLGIGNVDNTSDLNKPLSTATKTYVDTAIAGATIVDADATTKGKIQLAGDLAGTAAAPTVPGLALKENAANKSTTATLGTSDVLFPTQNAVKTYVDTAIAGATIVDADATTKGKIQLAGDLAGTAAAPTVPGLALKENAENKSTTTTLGTSDVLFPTQKAVKTYVDTAITGATIADADTATKGKIQLAGDLAGTAAAPTVPGLALKENVENKSTTTTLGTSDVLFPTQKAVKTYVDTAITGATIADADTATKGKIQLAGDLAGTAAAPTVPGLALKENAANKSTTTTLGTSDVLFPTQKAVKTYVDTAIAGATIADADTATKGKIKLAGDLAGTADSPEVATGAISTAKLATNAVTTAKITNASVTNAKLDKANIPLSGFAAAAAAVDLGSNKLTNVSNPTSAQDAATKNYVDTAITAATIADADATTKGKIQLAGDLAGTAASPTVPGLALKEDVSNKSTTTTLGTSDSLYPTQNAVKTYADAKVVDGISDSVTSSAPSQNAVFDALALKANAADVTTSLALKEDAANKTLSVTIDGASDVKFPSAKAVKNYVDTAVSGSTTSVPYTGALAAVNLGAYDLTVNGVKVGLGAGQDTSNTVLGNSALNNNTTGVSSVAVGFSALKSSTTANSNTAIGNGAMEATTSGGGNVAIGMSAMSKNTIGQQNTAIGQSALYNNTDASANTVIGNSAGASITTGGYNTIIGTDAAGGLITGSSNTIIGRNVYSGDVSNNIIIGNGQGQIKAQHDGTSWTLGTVGSGVWNGTEIAIAKGGTGATTAAAALTNLGAQSSANLSTNLTTDGASLTKYPAVKTIKDYVDSSVSSGAPDATASLSGKIQLTGDLTGSATSPAVATGAITSAKILDGTIAADDIADGTITGAKLNSNLNAAAKTFTFYNLVLGSGGPIAKISTDDGGNKPLSFYPNFNVESTRFWGNGNITIQTGGTYTDNGYKLEVDGTTKFNGNSTITGTVTGTQFTSTATTGTAPFVVTSTTPVANLSIGGNAATVTTNANLAGDVTSSGNTTTIGANKVVTGMIADANVTNGKLDKTNIPLSGFGAATADVALGAKKLTAVADPTLAQDAATKNYVDTATAGITTLANGKIYLGNASNEATEVTPTGDVTITNAGVTAIGTEKVVAGMLATDAVETAKIKNLNVTTGKLADDAVTTVKITDANVTTGKLADGAVTTVKIADDAVTTLKITDANVTAAKLATDAVETAKIKDAAVTYAKIQNVSTSNKVLGRVSANAGVVEEIATTGSGDVVRATSPTLVTPVLGAATGTSLSVSGQLTSTVAIGTAPLVVTSTTPVANLSIGGNAATVTTNANLNGPITSVGNATTITDGAVTTAKILDGTIAVGDLADNAVETAKIKDAAVTYAKIQNISASNKVLGRVSANAGVVEEIATTGSGDVVRATSPTLVTPVLGAATGTSLSVSGQLTSTVATGTAPLVVTSTTPVANLSIGGNAATVTTNANLTGDVTSSGNATTIADDAVTSAKIKDGEIINADLSASAAIADTKLATIATAGKVSNSATTATDANTPSAIVARDANGNFTAGTITANLTGVASKATNLNGGSLGDIAYQSAANTSSFLSGNTSATKKFLTQTGTGSAAVAPAWGTVGTADLTDLGANVATFLATPSSINLFNAMTNKTGTGSLVFNTSPTLFSPTLGIASATSVAFSGSTSGTATIVAPAIAGTTTITLPGATGTLATLAGAETLTNKTLTTPNIGVATATSVNKVILTEPTTIATLTIAEGKTLTANNSIILAGTDDKTMTFPTTDATIARTDAAQTFTGVQTFSSDIVVNSVNIGRGKGAVASNTAVGTDAISATATGADNTALGYNALKVVTSGARNTAVGSLAAASLTTGNDNSVLGFQALKNNTTGYSNVAIGKSSLINNTTGISNIAIGTDSGLSNTTGNYNIAVGQSALGLNTTGVANSAIGGNALYATTTGNYNSALGWQSLAGNTTGIDNVAVGYNAGRYDTTGTTAMTSSSLSVYLGASTKGLNATGSVNETVIGNDAVGLGSNSTVIGNSTTTKAAIYGALSLPDATDSTSSTTGALKVTGGVGIAKSLTIGSTTTSSSTTTGALKVAGGAGIAGNAYIGGTISIAGGSPAAGKVLTSDANGLGTWTTPTGVTTMAAIGTTPNANGATISGVNLNLEPASVTYGGVVTTGAQTFAGAKTFSPTLTAAADGETLVGLDINPTFTNGSYAGLTNYGLRVQGIGFGRGGGAIESNIAIGSGVLIRNSSGAYNTGLGYRALLSNTTGSGNTSLGSLAGAYTGATGSGGNASGTNSTFIGYNTSPLADGDDNEVVIAGGNATTRTVGLGSNSTLIGNAATIQTRIMGALDLPDTTESSSSTTGALKVTGGVGIAKSVTIGSTTVSSSTATGALKVAGGVGIAGALNVGTTATITGATTISSTTASSSTTTGALKVGGGVGIVGNTYIGGTLSIAGGSPGAGKVLTSDAAGLATWTNASGSAVSTGTASYQITLAESIVFYTGTAAGTFSIPDPAPGNAGKEITIKNKTAFGITITPTSTGKIYIDSANTAVNSVSIGIEASNNWIKLVSDGSQWNVLRALF